MTFRREQQKSLVPRGLGTCLSIKQFLTLGNDNVKQADLGENPGFMSVEFYAGMNLIGADMSQECHRKENSSQGRQVQDVSMFKTLQDTPANVTVASRLGSSLSIFLQSAGLLASKKNLYITISGNLLNISWFPLLGGIDTGVPTAQCPVPSTFTAVTLPTFCSCLLLLQCRKHPQT